MFALLFQLGDFGLKALLFFEQIGLLAGEGGAGIGERLLRGGDLRLMVFDFIMVSSCCPQAGSAAA